MVVDFVAQFIGRILSNPQSLEHVRVVHLRRLNDYDFSVISVLSPSRLDGLWCENRFNYMIYWMPDLRCF